MALGRGPRISWRTAANSIDALIEVPGNKPLCGLTKFAIYGDTLHHTALLPPTLQGFFFSSRVVVEDHHTRGKTEEEAQESLASETLWEFVATPLIDVDPTLSFITNVVLLFSDSGEGLAFAGSFTCHLVLDPRSGWHPKQAAASYYLLQNHRPAPSLGLSNNNQRPPLFLLLSDKQASKQSNNPLPFSSLCRGSIQTLEHGLISLLPLAEAQQLAHHHKIHGKPPTLADYRAA
ncbi:hypothetical protein HU200_046374 [Digitaria exilis]|uniref:Uncharacterized protein n=1 Tax=Digitaria exilis TaxID=1010633 RepID=A0A835AWZ3_9POAL|nr:hypothetical protein HU200_046374 [Digitaria exilis]